MLFDIFYIFSNRCFNLQWDSLNKYLVLYNKYLVLLFIINGAQLLTIVLNTIFDFFLLILLFIFLENIIFSSGFFDE